MGEAVDTQTGEIIELTPVTGVVEQHERAAMDVQVATAQALGRSITAFQADLEQWCCSTQEIASDCTFNLKKGGKPIIGPSIRFAELLQVAYRHIVAETYILEEEHKTIKVGAQARDLFRNVGVKASIRRNILDRNGKRYTQDMIQTTTQAAGSIALRNAIIRLIPRALWEPIWIKSRVVAQGRDPKTGKMVLPHGESVSRAINHIGSFGITEAEIMANLGVAGAADVTPDDLMLLRASVKKVQIGEATPEEAFAPMEENKSEGADAAADVQDRIRTAAASAPKKTAKKKAAKKKAAAKKPDPEPEEEAPPAEEPEDDDGIPEVQI